MMRALACTLILLAFPVCAQVPPGAAAGGYTTKIWGDNFTTFDQSGDFYQTWWTGNAVILGNSLGTATLQPYSPPATMGIQLLTTATGGWSSIFNHPPHSPSFEPGWKHGYFEAYIRLKTGGSILNNWAAFWLEAKPLFELTDGYPGTQTWCEIDIFEALPYHHAINASEHWWTWPSGGKITGVQNSNSVVSGLAPDPLDGNWHTYGLLWQPGKITWYFDNTAVLSINSYPGCDTQPMTLILSAQSRGKDQQETDVGWVSVWQ